MCYNKLEIFEKRGRMTIDKVCKALSDPKRLEILKILNEQIASGECELEGKTCNCVLKKYFNMSQPTLTYHLQILEDAELIMPYKEGKYTFYNINQQTILKLATFFKELHEE